MAVFVATAQRGLPPTPYDQAIAAATRGDWQLETLVRAVITRESGWEPGAINPEPGSRYGPSYGLMQVTLPTARLFDPTIQPDDLLDPWLNVAVGTEYLRDLLGRYPVLSDAIAAYNAGTPRRDAQGRYINESHVSDVVGYYTFYQNRLPAITEEVGATIPAEDASPTGTGAIWLAAGLLLAALAAGAWRARR